MCVRMKHNVSRPMSVWRSMQYKVSQICICTLTEVCNIRCGDTVLCYSDYSCFPAVVSSMPPYELLKKPPPPPYPAPSPSHD